MLSLGTLRKDAPLRWAAVVAIRLFLALCVLEFLIILLSAIPYCRRARKAQALWDTTELSRAVGTYLRMTGRMPASLEDLRVPQPGNDGEPIVEIGCDPWGRLYGFTVDGPRAVTITCLGADGAPGGTGSDEDIVANWPSADEGAPR